MVTNNAANIPTGASGTVLQGQGVGSNAAFSTATYPATTTSQQILYSTATNTVGQLTTANSKLPATNSSGTLAMRAFSVAIQTFTSNGTYTPATGMLYCKIEILGGGGAGGGMPSTTAGQFSSSSGGGSGEYAVGVFSAATIGASQSVTIGGAGAGSSGAAGGSGGNSSVGALISANGGGGGQIGAASATQSNCKGGSGGTGGSGGSYRTPGGIGLPAFTSGVVFGVGGQGANSQLGSGAQWVVSAGPNAATGFGAGGGGGVNGGGQPNQTGGTGSAGIVVVTEFIIN